MPGSEKITSVTIAPLISAPSWSPMKVTVGMSAFGRDVALEDRLVADPLRPRGLDEVLLQHADRARPHEAHERRPEIERQRDRRQDHRLDVPDRSLAKDT